MMSCLAFKLSCRLPHVLIASFLNYCCDNKQSYNILEFTALFNTVPARLPTTAKAILFKTPNFLKFQKTPFDPAKYDEKKGEEERVSERIPH